MPQVDLRIMGTLEDVEGAEELLTGLETFLSTGEVTPGLMAHRGRFEILERSRQFVNRNRSKLIRIYIKLKL